ncbi:MAG: type III PLP-dependent enzyme [archaeon]|jgi:ornithine decarboxylase
MFSNRGLFEYLSKKEFARIKRFAKGKKTPFLIIDLKKIEEKFDELMGNIPYAKLYYAVKANPEDDIIKMLAKKGSNFDVATVFELDQLLKLKVSPDKISFGNTIKKEEDIAYAYKKGIRIFATDSISDVKKIARAAPGVKVFFRIIMEGGSADWPLSKKFGAHPDMIYHLIFESKKLGLIPYGVSFHVGSQQRDIGQWDQAIAQCRYLFDAAREEGIELKLINMGGGFPANYISPTHNLETYAKEITRFLEEDFGENFSENMEIIIEPGRSIVADAGVIVTEVVMISKKSLSNQYEWMYLDIGKFGGLIETLDESIKYPIFTENYKKPPKEKDCKEMIIAGPTCDSMDILYEKHKYLIPKSVREGDRLYILSTGAYTKSYSSIYFNGFPPLQVYIMKRNYKHTETEKK